MEKGDIFFIQEVGVICSNAEEAVKVLTVLPAETRLKQYADIDLKEDDEILLVNAKRVKSAGELEKIYETIEIDDEIKLGIRRGEEMQIVTFNKINPEKLPKDRTIVIKTMDANEEDAAEGAKAHKIVMHVSEENGHLLKGTGLLIGEKDGRLVVADKMPHSDDLMGNIHFEKGDIIESINGTEVSSFEKLSDIYNSVKTGDEVLFTLTRGSQLYKIAFPKPEIDGPVIMTK